MRTGWSPAFGPQVDESGARIRVCAPGASAVRAILGDAPPVPMAQVAPEIFEVYLEEARAGDRYRLQRDTHQPWPDPCSRWQPDGVHGDSMLIDSEAFAWTDAAWTGVPRHRLVIYELHVGTFTPEGTFAAVAEHLGELADLGVTAIELMPVAAFPGTRNWGYDGGALFAPSEHYGHPDDLRALIDQAHARGLAVLLDVVYNHLGPDGAYAAAWMPTILTERHSSPWGRGINLDGPGSPDVRRLICDNALHWLLDYHVDGLRLDATHALADDSPEHILAQLAREVATFVRGRETHLIAEDQRNLATLLHPIGRGGHGMTGVWADDFHHAVRRHLAGDHDVWFADFAGTTDEVAIAVRDGWVFTGQHATHYDGPRGTSPAGVPIEAAVISLQNHDQVGNRAHGERLHHQIGEAAWLAATTLLLTAPETPLLFMGQEWAASTPFLFFTDHGDELGALVTEGRRSAFARLSAFVDAEARDRIAGPQEERTWRLSQLRWDERSVPAHAHVLAQTRALLAIRQAHVSGQPRDRGRVRCTAVGPHGLWLEQPSMRGGRIATFVDFSGTAPREIEMLTAGSATTLHLLHASSPAADGPVLNDLRLEGGRLLLQAAAVPFAVVLHLAPSAP